MKFENLKGTEILKSNDKLYIPMPRIIDGVHVWRFKQVYYDKYDGLSPVSAKLVELDEDNVEIIH